ncbi:MAG: tryptophan synthase subunit alpha [SAR202 cluster bacterium]|nr:tryptophan synthase subunit alpha [SAR202 cluster bacterium]
MTNRIKKTFENLQLNDKKGIILYLTTGIPDNETTAELALELFNSGADIIELGIPFSDPLADGVTIQQSSQKALDKGVNIDTCFDVCKMIRNKNDNNPIVLMGYFNPILQYGLDEFISKAKSCGVDGIIVPDLPLEESLILLEKCSSNDINLIYLIAPTTSAERIKEICKNGDGFLYCVSVAGITGARATLSAEGINLVKEVKQYSTVPVALGFGISTKIQLAEVNKHADAGIIGSALVNIISNSDKNTAVQNATDFLKELQ